MTDSAGRSRSSTDQVYIKAANADANDVFGRSVALEGDTLVIGATGEDGTDNQATSSGAVYVFRRIQDTWKQQAYIKASNSDANDVFGRSVALYGDTLAIGAYGEDGINNSRTSSGAVYIFTRTRDAWSQKAYIKASNSDSDDAFGFSLALDGDTLAIGAYGEDGINNKKTGSGAVYVFTRVRDIWNQQAYIKASNSDPFDQFGRSVALEGDTLAIGASGEDGLDNKVNNGGAVYIFTRNQETWSQEAYIKASNCDAFDNFGGAIALHRDTLAVGASQEDGSGNEFTRSGAVYIFTRNQRVWSQQAYIKASNHDAADRFGDALAIDGNTLAIGAYGEDSPARGVDQNQGNAPGAAASGAVYLFTRIDGAWHQRAYVKAFNSDTIDRFGSSVAVDGTSVAVGAHREDSANPNNPNDNNAPDSGAVYIQTFMPERIHPPSAGAHPTLPTDA